MDVGSHTAWFWPTPLQVPDDYAPAPPAQPAAPAAASLGTDSSSGSSSSSSHVQLRSTAGSDYLSLTAEVTHDALRSLEEAGEAGPAATAAALSAALAAVQGALPALGLSWHSALFVHLYVPSMAHFGAANEAYSRFFPPINPPSRATVEIGSNAELALVVEVLFARWAGLGAHRGVPSGPLELEPRPGVVNAGSGSFDGCLKGVRLDGCLKGVRFDGCLKGVGLASTLFFLGWA